MDKHRSGKTAAVVLILVILMLVFAATSLYSVFRGASVLPRSDETALPAFTDPMHPELAEESIYDLALQQTVYLSWSEHDADGNTLAINSGSGIVLTADGYLLTNAHCVADAVEKGEPITAELYDGSSCPAAVVGVDTETDVALLKLDKAFPSPAVLGSSRSLRPSQRVFVMGHPAANLKFSITSGIISGLDRRITFSDGTTLNLFQLDAAVNPGNSGGPVYDMQGRVIGVVTAKYVTLSAEGIGFATPIDLAMEIAEDLKAFGYVRGRPLMGITVTSVLANEITTASPAGCWIISVEPGLCGEKAGLRKDDVIVAMDGAPVTDNASLLELKKSYQAGDTVTLRVWRDGAYQELEMTFDEVTPQHKTGTVYLPAEPEEQTEADIERDPQN